ncbi:MAG: lytic transglycosylase domain-containing protein [Clostridia bacterium]|nr:lytic transglycosylase domain-containing protein [Clostridia bacterium]
MGRYIKIFLAAVAIIIAIVGMKSGYDTGKQVTYPVAYGDWIMKYSAKNDLDPFLVMAVIKQESNFVPEAHSGYAGGLMQLTPETARWNAKELGISDYDYMDPETNIKLGCHYLKYLLIHYGNIDTALAAYNGGMGNVNSWLSSDECSSDGVTLDYIPFPETRNYVVKVNGYWEYYRELYK